MVRTGESGLAGETMMDERVISDLSGEEVELVNAGRGEIAGLRGKGT